MSFNRSSMFPASGGTRRTVSMVNAFSTAGYSMLSAITQGLGDKTTSSGALTSGVLATMLNVTGAGGVMTNLTVITADATARTLRLVITVDSVVVYDVTSASTASSGSGIFLAGNGVRSGTNSLNDLPPISWTTSIKIEIASSLTETNKFTIGWAYNTEA